MCTRNSKGRGGESAMKRPRGNWVSLLFALPVIAGGGTAWAFSWGQEVTITNYYAYAGGDAYIVTSNNQNPDRCPYSNYLELDSSQPLFSTLYATVIAAYTAGEPVTINYNGCSSTGYPLVNAIAVPGP